MLDALTCTACVDMALCNLQHSRVNAALHILCSILGASGGCCGAPTVLNKRLQSVSLGVLVRRACGQRPYARVPFSLDVRVLTRVWDQRFVHKSVGLMVCVQEHLCDPSAMLLQGMVLR